MRKLILLLMLGLLLAIPYSALAQGSASLSFVTVQLWPEYDQPAMLVIVDFQTAASMSLPATLTFRIPAEAELIAVASDAGSGQFVNVPYEQPTQEGEHQVFSMNVDNAAPYRFEYYQPLGFDGNTRIFSYLWDNNYAVEKFEYLLLEPLDMSSVSLNPNYSSKQVSNGSTYYEGVSTSLAADEQYALTLNYVKTTDALVSQPTTVQTEPVNEDTPGRVSLANSLPYVIGGLGLIMIAGGFMYYFQWGRRATGSGKTRKRANTSSVENSGESVYCPQCGARAKPSDRFCRTCGSRLRHKE
ncbi:hypothetical protein MASR2M66_07340 [Chloroflexota bacterium]